jgi:molybdate transport system permease protein
MQSEPAPQVRKERTPVPLILVIEFPGSISPVLVPMRSASPRTLFSAPALAHASPLTQVVFQTGNFRNRASKNRRPAVGDRELKRRRAKMETPNLILRLNCLVLPLVEEQSERMNWQAFELTIRLSVLVAAILLIIGLPVAYWIAFSQWRWKFLIEAVVALPIVLPPTVLGFYILIALGARSPFARCWQALTGHTLAFSFEGLVVGSVVYSLPFAVQPFAAAFASVDARLIAASATLGASRLRTFTEIVLPLSVPGLITGASLSFAHTLGEFGVVLMVGGNIPGVTRTVSIDIYDKVQALDYRSANSTALVLLAISFVILSFIYALNRRDRENRTAALWK